MYFKVLFGVFFPLMNKNNCKYNMHNQNKRHKNTKIPFFRFMTENKHSGQCSCTAAYKAYKEKRAFAYPPLPFYCFFLIDAHKNKADNIYNTDIKYNRNQKLFHISPFIKANRAAYTARSAGLTLFIYRCLSDPEAALTQ